MVTLTFNARTDFGPYNATPAWNFPGPYSESPPDTSPGEVFTQTSTSIQSGFHNPTFGHWFSTIGGTGLAISGGAISADDTQPYTFTGTVNSLAIDFGDDFVNKYYVETISGLNTPLSALLGNGQSGGHYFITTLMSISDILSGDDQIQDLSSASFPNRLTVSLFGYDGNDTIIGSGAHDIYTGGPGADAFQPGAHTGASDEVKDFTPGVDKLDVSHIRLSLAGIMMNASQVGSDTVVTLPGTGTDGDGKITLDNVQKTDLHFSDFTGYINKTGFEAPAEWVAATPSDQGWYVGDFTGDHRSDILRYHPGLSGAEVLISTGSSFTGGASWTGAGNDAQGWYVGDFNGDGKDDIFRYDAGVSGAEVLLSTGSSFSNPVNWTGAGNDGHWYVGDFNGDGKDDIFTYRAGVSGALMFLSNGASFQPSGSWTSAGLGTDDKWYVGDFNGDGKADIFRYVAGSSGADMFLSNGSGFVHDQSWTGAGQGTDGTWYVGDVNGDGKADIFRYIDGQSGADVFLSNGSGFVHDHSWTGASKGTDGHWYVGDFDADGTADLLRAITAHGTDVLI